MRKTTILLIFLLGIVYVQAQEISNGVMRFNEQRKPVMRENIVIPNVNGYEVLKCDFHMHTVFSDGHVWPSVRLQEVWTEGLDAMAITDHIEYTPHKDDVKLSHNRSHELLKSDAEKRNIILIKGTEVTRNTPPGHFNAIFIGDATEYIESRETGELDKQAVMKAADQGAFIFWNHPGWQPKIEGSYEWLPLIDELYKSKALHGIEVFNGFGFHMKALDWCIDNNLTVMGSTDIHNLIQHEYDMSKDYIHRSMTLILSKDRSAESIREALDAGRTVAWASKYLAGKEENVRNLFNACVELKPSYFTEEKKDGSKVNYYELKNNSDLYFELELTAGNGTQKVVLYPQTTQTITANGGQETLQYDVTTAYVRSNKFLNVSFTLE